MNKLMTKLRIRDTIGDGPWYYARDHYPREPQDTTNTGAFFWLLESKTSMASIFNTISHHMMLQRNFNLNAYRSVLFPNTVSSLI
jgi:hypothetical protein